MTLPRWGPPMLLAARLVAATYGLFLLLFALDVFIPGRPAGAVAVEFVIHAAPTALLFFCLGVSWRAPRLAGLLVLGCALFFALLFQTYRSVFLFTVFTGTLLCSGVLFLLEDRRARRRTA